MAMIRPALRGFRPVYRANWPQSCCSGASGRDVQPECSRGHLAGIIRADDRKNAACNQITDCIRDAHGLAIFCSGRTKQAGPDTGGGPAEPPEESPERATQL